jgi:hypothetical protein
MTDPLMRELEKTGPQFLDLAKRMNAAFWEKEAQRMALYYTVRELEELPPSREEGEAFFNKFFDEIEAVATARAMHAFGNFAASRLAINGAGRIRDAALAAIDPDHGHTFGLDLFLIPVMRAGIPDVMDKIGWPKNEISDTQRLAKIAELHSAIEVVSSEKDSIGAKMEAFGITPKRPE